MSIGVGEAIPEATLMVMSADGPVRQSSRSLLAAGTSVLFGVPGAFTPTCSARHLPGFIDQAARIHSAGADRIVCMAVNDVFVIDAWGKSAGVGDAVIMAADGNGEFSRALGLEMDASAYGMGQRCQRFAMITRNGIIEHLMVEDPGEFRVSSADSVVERLRARD